MYSNFLNFYWARLHYFEPISTWQMVFASFREISSSLAAEHEFGIWSFHFTGFSEGGGAKSHGWQIIQSKMIFSSLCTMSLRRSLQTYDWPAHWPAQLVQRGHTVEWRPQGVQLPLQQGEIQGSAAHANRVATERKRVGLHDQTLAGVLELVIQECFGEINIGIKNCRRTL